MTADQRATDHAGIVPFALNVPTEAIDDLHSRLRASRFPEHETVLGSHDEWAQGIPLTYVHELCQYWLQ